jgi:hypothetical protein
VLPPVTSTLRHVAHDVPFSLQANGRGIHAEFELDRGSEVEVLISDSVATGLGLDVSDPNLFSPVNGGAARAGSGAFHAYNGIVEISFTTARGSIRSTRTANAVVGGADNVIGLPTMGRLRIGVANTTGIICVFPMRAPKIVNFTKLII